MGGNQLETASSKKTGFLSNMKVTTELALLGSYIAMVIVFSLLSPYFLSVKNFLNIGLYASIMAVTATGMTMALLSGGLDLSVGSVMSLVGMIVATSITKNGSPVLPITLGLLVGLACGLINGLLITKVKINPLITTLATMQIYRGCAFIYTNGVSVQINNPNYKWIGRGYILGIPVPLVITLVMFLIFWFVLKYTVFGRKIYSIGGNSQASYLSGINVNKVRLAVYVIVSFTAAISGIILSSQAGAGLPQGGTGMEMQVISAVILGGASLSGGKGNILGTFLGVLILSTLSNGMVLLNVPSFWQMVTTGVVLVLAVASDVLRGGGYK